MTARGVSCVTDLFGKGRGSKRPGGGYGKGIQKHASETERHEKVKVSAS